MKKTAIQQLMNELIEFDSTLFNIHSKRGSRFLNQFHKYLEMEKEQIIDAFWNGDNTDCTSEQNSKQFAEQYYNETYKSE